MEQILSVEETQIKDKKCILLRIKGGKQFVLQCEVSFIFTFSRGKSLSNYIDIQQRCLPGYKTFSYSILYHLQT